MTSSLPQIAGGVGSRRAAGAGVLLWFVLGTLCGLSLCLQAAATLEERDPAKAFEAANKLYEEGAFRPAAEAYEAIAARGRVSASLYFNLGNARFKAGELGRAIVSYRLAARLAPRDPDIEANLRMAREVVSGSPPPAPSLWRRLVHTLTLNEWATLAGVSLWACFVLLACREANLFRSAGLRRWILVSATGAVVSGVGLFGAWKERHGREEAVVIVPEAVVRYGPLEVSPQLEVAHDGLELVVLDRKDEWLQITGLKRGTGWIREADVALMPR